jgi:hypothetical protein
MKNSNAGLSLDLLNWSLLDTEGKMMRKPLGIGYVAFWIFLDFCIGIYVKKSRWM